MDNCILVSEFKGKYSSYLIEYCVGCGYEYISDLTMLDYIAIKAKYKLDNHDISEIKNYLSDITSYSYHGNEDFEVNEYDCPKEDEELNDFESDTIACVIETTEESNIVEIIDTFTEREEEEDNSVFRVESLDEEEYLYDSIKNITLSVRATNALWSSGIKSVEQLVNISSEEIFSLKNVGIKTLNEIVRVKGLLSENRMLQEECSNDRRIIITKNVDQYLKNLFCTFNHDVNCEITLSESDKELINELNEAVEVIGFDFAKNAYHDPNICMDIVKCMEGFHRTYYRKKRLYNRATKIPEAKRCNKLTCYFENCDYLKNKIKASENNVVVNNKIFDDSYTIFNLIDDIYSMQILSKQEEKEICDIIDYLCLDLENIFNEAIDSVKGYSERAYEILWKRVTGETLQQIADGVNLTRERVRQLEKKAILLFEKYVHSNGISILDYISADLGGDNLLTISELKNYFNDKCWFELLYYVESNYGLSTKFEFDKDLRVFRRKGVNRGNISFDDFPDIVFDDEVERMVLEYSNGNDLLYEEVLLQFYYTYKYQGKTYYKNRLTKELMYDYIVEKYYPSGIHLYDDIEINNFRNLLIDKFGDVKLPENNRAFEARISSTAVLCDRGTYIHKSRIQVNDITLSKIENYVECMSRDSISFNELFEAFREELTLNSNIGNRYFLQGVMKIRFKEKYYYTRDYLSKTGEITIARDLESFIKEKGRLHKREIFEHFAGITDIVLNLYTIQNRNIIMLDCGEYMHSNLLNILDHDYSIKDYLIKQTAEFPVSTRKLIVEMWNQFPDFLIRNNINTHSELYGALRFMFEDEFKFSRPFIASKSSADVTNLSVIKKHMTEYDSITIAEMIDIYEKYHIKYMSIRVVIRNINDEFLRISDETLARYNSDELSDETLQKIYDLLKEKMGEKGYISGRNITDYIFFPDINFEWNAFLIRAIVERFLFEKISMVDIPTTETYAMNTIFVSEDIDAETYEELVSYALRIENNKEHFSSMEEILEWLKTEGFFISEPNKVILESNIICIDEYGGITIN